MAAQSVKIKKKQIRSIDVEQIVSDASNAGKVLVVGPSGSITLASGGAAGVQSVTAGDASITVGGTVVDPTVMIADDLIIQESLNG